ncbi:MAG TPA: sulfate ABC transporter permease subunit CysT [Pirellulales bacterium]|nr:sulfate ABC transporter permease subunit CysT [Pirellulales bacterium]
MNTALHRRVLPGFRLGLSYTLLWVGLLVIVPLAGCLAKASSLSLDRFLAAAWNARARAAYSFTFSSSLAAALANVLIGLLVAWVLVRYEFPGKRFVDSLVDLPFALPTAVAGLVYSQLYVANGWLGRFLVPLGIQAAYSRLAVILVLVFVGFPFVVRTLQPVLESLDADVEEAAALLGASRGQTFRRVILPGLLPALMTGFALSLARAIGEYGSVVFVSGNMPFRTEIAPVLIVARLEEFAYAEATAIATVLLAMSMGLLVAINFLEHWSKRHHD